jgi:hypothetical protein
MRAERLLDRAPNVWTATWMASWFTSCNSMSLSVFGKDAARLIARTHACMSATICGPDRDPPPTDFGTAEDMIASYNCLTPALNRLLKCLDFTISPRVFLTL